MIRVLVVDDYAVVRTGLEQLLAAADDLTLAPTAADGAEAVRLAREVEPDVVLMDLAMPVLDGIAATRRIVADRPATRVVVLTSFADPHEVRAALDAGAAGYILKDARPDEILSAVRSAHRGGTPLDPQVARVMLDAHRPSHPATDLTARELEVLRLLVTGLGNKQLAQRLRITQRTVKAHLTGVYRHIGVSDRTQAIVWAHEHLPATGFAS